MDVTTHPTFRLAAAAFAMLFACANSSETTEPEKSVLAGSPVQDVLVLPLNVASPTPQDLVQAEPLVWEELENYLRSHGMRLRTVNYQTARQFWLGSIKQVRSKPGSTEAGYDDAARVMIGKLQKYGEFDTVVAPSIYITQAAILEKSATWDEVERTVPIETRSLAARAVADGVPLEGLAPAASIHIAVFDRDGNKIQEGRGGLELLVEVRVKHNPYGPTDDPVFQFGPRANAFDNGANVREGIARALTPFLPPLLPTTAEEANKTDPVP
jgi:hypothetical protein